MSTAPALALNTPRMLRISSFCNFDSTRSTKLVSHTQRHYTVIPTQPSWIVPCGDSKMECVMSFGEDSLSNHTHLAKHIARRAP